MVMHPLDDHPEFTPDFCEREYNSLAGIPDRADVLARWASDGLLARRTQSAQLSLPYGDAPAETLDFFPARKADAPLFVFMHGGYWRALGKSDFSWVAPALVARGAAVAIVDYGLAPATPIEEIVRQMLRAHAWLYRNARQLGANPNHIVTSGHSAGGHMAAMLLAASWRDWSTDLPADLIKGALAISGLYDLEPVAKAAYTASLQLDAQRVLRLSPAYMKPGNKTPLIPIAGGDETNEFQRQTALISTLWPANAPRSVIVPGKNHLTVCDALGDVESPVFAAAIELLQLSK